MARRLQANDGPTEERSSFDVYPATGSGPTFTVNTIHISCQSDSYRGSDKTYGGIILYARNGETDWCTANGRHCKTGYLVIKRTDTEEFKELQRKWSDEPGKVLGVIYKKAFGESCRKEKVVGEGFGIINGEFKIVSGACNPTDDDYHDSSYLMHGESAQCVQEVVNFWKRAGPDFPDKQNYSVMELLQD